MKSGSIVLFLPLFIVPVIVQGQAAVRGRVTDADNGQPLPFAQIAVQGTTRGTVTNDDGFFFLQIPDAGFPDTLMISFLGYATKRIFAGTSDTVTMDISLRPVSLDLREVEIVALTPGEVLRRAVDSIPVNYGRDPLILTAFIRTRKTVNNRLAEYTEAIVENLKDGYYQYKPGDADRKNRASNIPYLFKGRVTSDTNLVNLLGDVGASAHCLGCNFVCDVAEFPFGTLLDERDRSHYMLKMEELVNPEGGKIYRIRFDQDDRTNRMLCQGEILIEARSFAILRMTYKPSFKAFEAYEKNKNNRTWFLNNQPGWIQEMPLGETTITYSRRDAFWALSTIRNRYRITYVQPIKNQRIVYGYSNEVVVTDLTRDPERIRTYQGDKSIGVNQRWDELVGETDEAFWENFNYLPIEEELREELKSLER